MLSGNGSQPGTTCCGTATIASNLPGSSEDHPFARACRPAHSEHDPIHQAAAEWFTRLQGGDVSLQATLQWQNWMAAQAEHAQAFHRIEEVWRGLDAIGKPALTGQQELREDQYDGTVPIGSYLGRPAGRRRSQWTLAAAATFCAVGVGALFYAFVDSGAGTVHSIETLVGENRTLRLEDGSEVVLGGKSRLEVKLSSSARQLTLVEGEAFFTVANDPERPFSVRAGTATVTALGTEFNLRRSSDRVVVAVMEGQVLVEPTVPLLQRLSGAGERSMKRLPRRLQAGYQTTIGEFGFDSARHANDPALTTAWRNGRLAFEREQLRYVLQDVNRYAHKPVVFEDERIGDLRVTGTIVNDNIDGSPAWKVPSPCGQ